MVADNFLGFLRGIFLSLVSSALITITTSSYAEIDSTEENGDQLTVLMAMLFDDPTNLELNFQIMQAQMAEGNLEAAEATLERVLILDPTSRLARFLMAEIRIQLGKLASAKTLLQELVEDPDTTADTKERAYILIEQINAASKTTRHSGGYVIYAGQTQNAFGRSEENQILFLDLPVENTTKDKSDQYYGYDLYYRFLNELDYQTPTQIDSGIKFSKRDTHDPSLSDLKTFSADISLIRIDGYRATLGLFGSYTDVNNQDFSRSIGTTISGRTTFLNAVEISANLTANRSIYMPVETVADNPDKSSRSYSLQADMTRSTGTGVFERTGISLDANDGTWEGNLRLSIDFANRNIDSTAWGTFSGYNGGNSGSFRMEDSEVFAKSNSNCSTSGDCTIFTSPSLQKTCTGSTCNSGATSHSNVNLTATGRALLLQNQSTSYGMIGGLQLNDTSNSNALAAETAGNGVLLESQ